MVFVVFSGLFFKEISLKSGIARSPDNIGRHSQTFFKIRHRPITRKSRQAWPDFMKNGHALSKIASHPGLTPFAWQPTSLALSHSSILGLPSFLPSLHFA
jgi:hypothetical protein